MRLVGYRGGMALREALSQIPDPLWGLWAPILGVGGEGGAKRGAYLFVLKANQGELLEWASDVRFT
jgi:hypothetical protein